MLSGKSEALQLFEPCDPENVLDDQLAHYERAYELMAANDPSASQQFAAYVGGYGDDALGMFHLKRLLAGEIGAEITLDTK